MCRMCNEQLNLQSEGRSLSLPCTPHIRKAVALGIRTVAFLLWWRVRVLSPLPHSQNAPLGLPSRYPDSSFPPAIRSSFQSGQRGNALVVGALPLSALDFVQSSAWGSAEQLLGKAAPLKNQVWCHSGIPPPSSFMEHDGPFLLLTTKTPRVRRKNQGVWDGTPLQKCITSLVMFSCFDFLRHQHILAHSSFM